MSRPNFKHILLLRSFSQKVTFLLRGRAKNTTSSCQLLFEVLLDVVVVGEDVCNVRRAYIRRNKTRAISWYYYSGGVCNFARADALNDDTVKCGPNCNTNTRLLIITCDSVVLLMKKTQHFFR